MEQRNLKISFGKSGNGGRVARITLPIKWLDIMKLIPEDRSVVVNFDSEKKEIMLKKL